MKLQPHPVHSTCSFPHLADNHSVLSVLSSSLAHSFTPDVYPAVRQILSFIVLVLLPSAWKL